MIVYTEPQPRRNKAARRKKRISFTGEVRRPSLVITYDDGTTETLSFEEWRAMVAASQAGMGLGQ